MLSRYSEQWDNNRNLEQQQDDGDDDDDDETAVLKWIQKNKEPMNIKVYTWIVVVEWRDTTNG